MIRYVSKTILVLSIVVGGSACAGDAANEDAFTVRDSLGVRIVENTAPSWTAGTAWRLSDDPLLDIGGGDADEEQLFQVVGATHMSNGGVIVANGGSAQLKIFDEYGAFVAHAGGPGGGPGKFAERGLDALWRWSGDSIAAWDGAAARLSIFSTDGRYVRSVTIDKDDGYPRAVGLVLGGELIAGRWSSQPSPLPPTGVTYRDTVRYARYDTSGAMVNELGRFPGGTRFIFEWLGNSSFGTLPFGLQGIAATGLESFYFSSDHQPEIRQYDSGGGLTLVARVVSDPRPFTQANISAYTAQRMEDAPPDLEGRTVWQKWLAEQIPYPEHFPAFGRLLVDVNGNVWALHYIEPADPRRLWSVFEPDGRWLGTVEMPETFRVLEIGSDYALGVWTDDMDLEHVRLYELEKQ